MDAQTDAEEECSFLKIENVVSLATNSENNESVIENPIVSELNQILSAFSHNRPY